MSLVVQTMPFSLPGFQTVITFTTRHSRTNAPQILLENPAQFPIIPNSPSSLRIILPMLDIIICNKDAVWFLREVDEEIDQAPGYRTIVKHPIDLSTMRKRANTNKYEGFDQFAKDLQLLIQNAIIYNPNIHQVHQAALRLSQFIADLFHQFLKDPDSLKRTNKTQADAELKIAEELTQYQNKKRQVLNSARRIDQSKPKPAQIRRFSDTECDRLISQIMKLPGSSLRGVVEILKGSAFNESMIPFSCDLALQDSSVLQKLKKFLDSPAKITGRYIPACRPILPPDLQRALNAYSDELVGWKDSIRPVSE